jgi:hypothetical protein
MKWSNLSREERDGLISLRKGLKEHVIFQTDQSGRFLVDSIENYKSSTQPHIEGDSMITEEEYTRLQQLVNAHAVFWVRMIGAGEDVGSRRRIKIQYDRHLQSGPTAVCSP